MTRRRLVCARAFVAAMLGASALIALACGVRTLPRPPEDTKPRVATDLAAKHEGDGVHLEWERPSESMDGQRLADLARFLVERRAGGDAFTIIAEVPADTSRRLRPIKHYSYVDKAAPAGPVEYRIVCIAADGQRSSPSASAFIGSEVVTP